MAEVGKAKKNVSAAKAKHGTQGGAGASRRADSPRVPTGRAGGKGGGPKRG